jgi:hypothetical protein
VDPDSEQYLQSFLGRSLPNCHFKHGAFFVGDHHLVRLCHSRCFVAFSFNVHSPPMRSSPKAHKFLTSPTAPSLVPCRSLAHIILIPRCRCRRCHCRAAATATSRWAWCTSPSARSAPARRRPSWSSPPPPTETNPHLCPTLHFPRLHTVPQALTRGCHSRASHRASHRGL